jgi:hypothetical protein
MKRFVFFILIYGLSAVAVSAQQPPDPTSQKIVHVATALNHLTVLEFHEPVTMAAAGSSDFQIERQENKVFIKPMKSGVSTDLFVWTASRRFSYELETTQEVKNMNFAIDNSAPAPPPVVSAATDEFADMMLTRAFLGAIEIKQAASRPTKNQVNVRIAQVFRTRSSVYIHYTIENNGKRSYHVTDPAAYLLQADHPTVSLPSLVHRQLDERLLRNLGDTKQMPLPIAHAEIQAQELRPDEATQGVVAIRQDLRSPAVVQLVFDGGVKVTIVL